jgi:anti-sigma factor RsiW
MTCAEARAQLLDLQRGELAPERERELRAHLETCASCARARDAEEALTQLLEERLPLHPASGALKRRLAAIAPARSGTGGRGAATRGSRAAAAAAGAALVAAAVVAVVVVNRPASDGALAALTREAVNDHLRVLQRDPPVDVAAGDRHAVKPWFEGRLDFAPTVPAPVAPDMRLEGGSIGYFVDRRAAVVVYALRSHVVTLLVFRADGLPWPRAAGAQRDVARGALRGYSVFLWRSDGLGYALVGDVDPAELSTIARKLSAQT